MDSGINSTPLSMTVREVIAFLSDHYTVSTATATEVVYALLESGACIEQAYALHFMDTLIQTTIPFGELSVMIDQLLKEEEQPASSSETPLPPSMAMTGLQITATLPTDLSLAPADGIETMQHAFSRVIHSTHDTLRISSPYIEQSGVNLLLSAFETVAYRGVTLHLLIRINNRSRPEMRQIMALLALRELFGNKLHVRSFSKSLGQDHYRLSLGGIHAKLLVADSTQAYIGSGEIRDHSLHHNFEVGCVVSDPRSVALIAQLFDKMWNTSDEITAEYCRSFVK